MLLGPAQSDHLMTYLVKGRTFLGSFLSFRRLWTNYSYHGGEVHARCWCSQHEVQLACLFSFNWSRPRRYQDPRDVNRRGEEPRIGNVRRFLAIVETIVGHYTLGSPGKVMFQLWRHLFGSFQTLTSFSSSVYRTCWCFVGFVVLYWINKLFTDVSYVICLC